MVQSYTKILEQQILKAQNSKMFVFFHSNAKKCAKMSLSIRYHIILARALLLNLRYFIEY